VITLGGLMSGFRKRAKRFGTVAIGFSVLTVGIAMIVLPGPAIIVIPLGLSILAKEFDWAKRLMEKLKKKFKRSKASESERYSLTSK
jgi:hypothetical protein